MDICKICNKEIDVGQSTVTLTDRGSAGVNNASIERGGEAFSLPGDEVHVDCRRSFTDKKRIQVAKRRVQTETPDEPGPSLRSISTFDFRVHCLFCGTPVNVADKKRGKTGSAVQTMVFQNSIKRLCDDRDDEWGREVKGRINTVNDLHAADTIYHQTCSVNFRTKRHIPAPFSPPSAKRQRVVGRPIEEQQQGAFERTMEYFVDNDDEQITVADLVEKMKEYCSEPYTVRYMKDRVIKKFGTDVIITDINGKADVVTFCLTAKSILHDFYKQQKKEDPEAEKAAIITAASRIIRSEIKAMAASKQAYPVPSDIESVENNNSFVPLSLRALLENIFTEKDNALKIASIGQTIIQAVRPRVIICPLQISLGVQLHQQFASRFLIDTLNSLGYCSSYSEVKRFQSCAAKVEGSTKHNVNENACIQFVADNVDHNTCTLDGLNTFHGMGIMGAITPGGKSNRTIPRVEVSTKDILNLGTVDVIPYHKRKELAVLSFPELGSIKSSKEHWQMDLLSSIIWPLRAPKPAWSGFMQMIHKGIHPGESSIAFFPMIDLDPGDLSCIYSTLSFVCKEASKHGKSAIITFDQPLYWKSLNIIKNEPEGSELGRIVLRLGGFHLEMSFLGAIGHLMHSSGLQELLECVYAPNAVVHMLNGKAVSRAVRGHFLVESTLNAMIVSKVFNLPLPDVDDFSREDNSDSERAHDATSSTANESGEDMPLEDANAEAETVPDEHGEQDMSIENDTSDIHGNYTNKDDSVRSGQSQQEDKPLDSDLEEISKIFDSLTNKSINIEDACKEAVFERIFQKIKCFKETLSTNRTANLWFEYLNMVQLLHRLIRAERTGSWHEHLHTVHCMLPYLAAAGHNMYVKSAYMYLSDMQNLITTHPDVNALFESGFHVVRRSDRYWAGISTDLAIEQILMRSLKTSGGLTRGRGMSEFQRIQWLLSSPTCAEINDAMQTLTSVKYQSNDQHKDTSQSRQEKDNKDMKSLLSYLKERDPFGDNEQLRSIDSGMTADATVNVDDCHQIGSRVIASLPGEGVSTYTFRKRNQAVTMNAKHSIKIDGESVNVDPQLLFQRLTTVARGSYTNMYDLFRYELSNHPSSLFDTAGLPRQAQKSSLAESIWSVGDCSADALPPNTYFVLDGGSLLHKFPWPHKSTFQDICNMYVQYVQRKYGNATIVFDGYTNGPSTKDVTHMRRSKGLVGRNVFFKGNTTFNTKKDLFLSNQQNKQRFIELLSDQLRKAGCTTVHADEDADLPLVKTALEKSLERNVTLIGEDTDILILLLHHMDTSVSNKVFFMSDRIVKKSKIWDIGKAKTLLTHEVCRQLLFVHAVTGCDTTSRLHGIGKGPLLKKIISNTKYLGNAPSVFFQSHSSSTREMLENVGEEVMASLYGGLPGEGLDLLRFRKFVTKTSTLDKHVQVCSLPPTSAAAKYHTYRVYHQVQQWVGNTLLAQDWGWKLDDNMLIPMKTTLAPAPDELLNIIRCNCKSNCDSKRCSCRKHGIPCSMSCGQCRGTSCSNSEQVETEQE